MRKEMPLLTNFSAAFFKISKDVIFFEIRRENSHMFGFTIYGCA